MPTRADIREARRDLRVFARLVCWPLEQWQADALRFDTRQTVIVAPRQSGKSSSLALAAVWWAYRRNKQTVLVVSAGEEAANRLLRRVRELASHPLLQGSVIDESRSLLALSNGSVVRSVPASERQVRGHSVDLLIVDEAALIDEDLLLGAALPTTAARPDARVVLASSPWSDAGPFHALALAGAADSPHTRTFRWKLEDAHWITPAVVEAARASMSPLRFKAEFEGEFVGASDLLFAPSELLACVAPYELRRSSDGREAVTGGLDWGRAFDSHAVVLTGVLDDYGRNEWPVVFLPWLESSQRLYGRQIDEVVALSGLWRIQELRSETNGVGAAPTEALTQRARTRVVPVSSTLGSKEEAYSRLALLIAERRIVLPQHPELLRQLGGLVARPTPSGGLRIAAVSEATHDDLPDALSLAVQALPSYLGGGVRSAVDASVEWLTTPAGVSIPVRPRCVASLGAPARAHPISQYQLGRPGGPRDEWDLEAHLADISLPSRPGRRPATARLDVGWAGPTRGRV
jgi:hypothetical protein